MNNQASVSSAETSDVSSQAGVMGELGKAPRYFDVVRIGNNNPESAFYDPSLPPIAVVEVKNDKDELVAEDYIPMAGWEAPLPMLAGFKFVRPTKPAPDAGQLSKIVADLLRSGADKLEAAGFDREMIDAVSAELLSKAATSAANDVKLVTPQSTGDQTPKVIDPITEAAGTTASGNAATVTMIDTLNVRLSSLFFERFDQLTQTVAFKPDWLDADGLGMSAMVTSDELRELIKPTHQARAVDTHGRKVIITGTYAGMVVVYQESPDSSTLCYHAPAVVRLASLIRGDGKTLPVDEIARVLGDGNTQPNIGKRLQVLREWSTVQA